MKFSVGWMDCTGPDGLNVYSEKLYTKRRDAFQHFDELANAGKPCAVYRHTWVNSLSPDGTYSMVQSANLTSSA